MKLDLISNKSKEILSNIDLNPNDEYYTPEYAIEPILKYLKHNSKIWCPFDKEESNFVKILIDSGHIVTATHIENGFDFKNNDFEIMYFNKRISYFKSYSEPKPSLNPPFSSVYICKGILPKQIIFEELNKNNS